MEISGKTVVERPPDELWRLLLDPEVVCRCIPGCESLEEHGDYVYGVKLKVGFGLLKGRFQGEVRLEDVELEKNYKLVVKARGPTGFINGETSVSLTPLNGGKSTELEYTGEAHVGGALASVGARFFQNAARDYQHQFFQSLAAL